jgi:hypothetical protein
MSHAEAGEAAACEQFPVVTVITEKSRREGDTPLFRRTLWNWSSPALIEGLDICMSREPCA